MVTKVSNISNKLGLGFSIYVLGEEHLFFTSLGARTVVRVNLIMGVFEIHYV